MLWSAMAERERSARVGRPRLPGTAKYIRLRESVFNLWRERKESHGKLTDSEFAEFLLHRSHGRYFSVICFLAYSFLWASERASDRLERILPIWRQNLIGIFIFYFTFRDVRDPVASGDRSFQVSTTQDLGKPIGWQTVYIDVYILCVYPSNTLNRYICSSNVLLSFFFFHFPITRNVDVLKGLMHILLFI